MRMKVFLVAYYEHDHFDIVAMRGHVKVDVKLPRKSNAASTATLEPLDKGNARQCTAPVAGGCHTWGHHQLKSTTFQWIWCAYLISVCPLIECSKNL